MNTNDFKSPTNHDILHHLVEELSEAIENDPAALREALAEEGINHDNLTHEGLQFIRSLQAKQQTHEYPIAAEIGLFERLKTAIATALRPRRFFALPKYAYALAAVILMAISIWLFIAPWSSKEYIAGRGEQVEVSLPDGSKIKLNSASRLIRSQDFNKKSREVMLSGEAFFEVRKGNLPFVVTIEGASVRVMGTQFNVKSRNERIEVTVSEGVVAVASTMAHEDGVVTLIKGQATTFRVGELPAPPLPTHSEYPAWIQGKLAFYQTPLQEVVEELERRFGMSIELRDKNLEKIAITGKFESGNLQDILSAICQLTNKRYRVENEIYIID